MTIEELADFLAARTGCIYCNISECYVGLYGCKNAHLNWLKSDVNAEQQIKQGVKGNA